MGLKLLLEAAPRHVMVVLTGSSMSAAWLNTARMQASYSLLINSPGLDWPVKQSQRDLVMAWQALRNRHPEVPQELLRWSEPTSAALTKMALDWLDCGRPQNLQAFAADFTRAEFVEAVRALPPFQVLNFLSMQLNCFAQWSSMCIGAVLKQGAHKQIAVWVSKLISETLRTAQGAEMTTVVAISFHDPALRILQAHAEWAAALDSTTAADRRAILRLAHPTCGIQMGNLERGLRSYLWPFVSTLPSGVSWLTAPHHRQLLQVSSTVLCCPCWLCLAMSTSTIVWSLVMCMLVRLLSQPSHQTGNHMLLTALRCSPLQPACCCLSFMSIDCRTIDLKQVLLDHLVVLPPLWLQLITDEEACLRSVSQVNIGPATLTQLELRDQLLTLGETVNSIQSGSYLQGRDAASPAAAAAFMKGLKVGHVKGFS